MSLLDLLGKGAKIVEKLLQGRRERWKNEIDRLTKERKTLIRNKVSQEASQRVIKIDLRIAELNELIKNSAND